MRTLDDTRNVGHHKRMVVAASNDTQVGFERSEGVVCDLGLSGRDHRQQRRFTRIGETHQTHVGQHLQLQNKCTLGTLLARLSIAWSLVCCGLEVPVAQTAATAFEQNELLAIVGYFAHDLARLGITRNRTQRYTHYDILCVLT